MTTEEQTDPIKDELRKILDHIDSCIPQLTPLHFSDEDRQALKEQVSLWRWYISHGWFQKPYSQRNKPPLQWLLQELRAFPDVWTCASKLAAPGARDSLDLEQSAGVLKHQLRRVTEYPGEPAPIPSTFNLPKTDPRKTDQYGVPWAKSECEAAVGWRKAQAKNIIEHERRMEPPRVYQRTPEEVQSLLELTEKQRAESRKRREELKTRADALYEEARRLKRKSGNKA